MKYVIVITPEDVDKKTLLIARVESYKYIVVSYTL